LLRGRLKENCLIVLCCRPRAEHRADKRRPPAGPHKGIAGYKGNYDAFVDDLFSLADGNFHAAVERALELFEDPSSFELKSLEENLRFSLWWFLVNHPPMSPVTSGGRDRKTSMVDETAIELILGAELDEASFGRLLLALPEVTQKALKKNRKIGRKYPRIGELQGHPAKSLEGTAGRTKTHPKIPQVDYATYARNFLSYAAYDVPGAMGAVLALPSATIAMMEVACSPFKIWWKLTQTSVGTDEEEYKAAVKRFVEKPLPPDAFREVWYALPEATRLLLEQGTGMAAVLLEAGVPLLLEATRVAGLPDTYEVCRYQGPWATLFWSWVQSTQQKSKLVVLELYHLLDEVDLSSAGFARIAEFLMHGSDGTPPFPEGQFQHIWVMHEASGEGVELADGMTPVMDVFYDLSVEVGNEVEELYREFRESYP
jgi:hypothetical protein